MNLHEDREVFKDLINATAQHFLIPTVYVEKDYWVTFVLRNLSRSKYKKNLIFKGGTSLSKAYKLINRFSEDIDIAVHIEAISGNQLRNYLRDATATLSEGLVYIPGRYGESKHGNIRKTWHRYPRFMEGDFAQASQDLLIEINAFTIPEPFSLIPINSLIAEFLYCINKVTVIDKYGLEFFEVNVLSVQRTVAEKIMALVKASRMVDAESELKVKIRHIYDLCLIRRNTAFSSIFVDDQLLMFLELVRKSDREQFSNAGDWLDLPINDALIYAFPEKVWKKISGEFYTRFAPLVYNRDLPDDEEVIAMLGDVRKLLQPYN